MKIQVSKDEVQEIVASHLKAKGFNLVSDVAGIIDDGSVELADSTDFGGLVFDLE